MTVLTAVRHGETEWNTERRLMGSLDSPLTPLGLEQAVLVADRLAKEGCDVLYSSDLGRAMATATVIGDRLGIEPTPSAALREHCLGIFQGQSNEENEQLFPDEYQRYRLSPGYVIPEGESLGQLYDRVASCFSTLVEENTGKHVIAVTHGGVLNCLFRFIVGQSLDSPRAVRLLNASVNVVEVEDGRWLIRTWGDVAHLT